MATTVGRPVAGVELAIVDDDGQPVPDGSVGRVLLRSGAAMRGYWGSGPARGRRVDDLVDAAATSAVLAPDGWVTTGDFGRRTPEGNLQLSGRAHERYIRGGYNVYPAEVEEALSTHPSVAGPPWAGCPTTSSVKSAWPSWSPRPARCPSSPCCAPTAPGSGRLQGT